MNELVKAGYDHYEISNFARQGFRSKHNSRYWRNIPYLGIGPSAHSYDGVIRHHNVASNSVYISSISGGTIPHTEEILSLNNRYNEFVMIRLRTAEGLNILDIQSEFGSKHEEYFLNNIEKYLLDGAVIKTDHQFKLSRKGQFIADRISSDLFYL